MSKGQTSILYVSLLLPLLSLPSSLYLLVNFFVISLAQALLLSGLICLWSSLFASFKSGYFFSLKIDKKGISRLTSYLLVFTFFVFYQLFLTGDEKIVFAATPCSCESLGWSEELQNEPCDPTVEVTNNADESCEVLFKCDRNCPEECTGGGDGISCYPSDSGSVSSGSDSAFTVNIDSGYVESCTLYYNNTNEWEFCHKWEPGWNCNYEGCTSTSTSTTTSTTTFSTSSTSTTTSTTTTIPFIECENDKIYINNNNTCSQRHCYTGMWRVKNYENQPLDSSKTIDIEVGTPSSIDFGPAKRVGKILTKVYCYDPEFEIEHMTEVRRGPHLSCDEVCGSNEVCECEVTECTDGFLLLKNYENNSLDDNLIEYVNDTFSHSFSPGREGKVEARMRCIEPFYIHQVEYIEIVEGNKFEMSKIVCNENHCTVDVGKNFLNKKVDMFIQLFEEPRGTIYYKGEGTVNPGLVDNITIPITEVNYCSVGTHLKVLALAYLSDYRIDRLTSSYEC